jgi:site-specific recombinase XerD
MREMLLANLIQEVKNEIVPLRHSQSTLYQYDHAWQGLCRYFSSYGQAMYSTELSNQYVFEAWKQYETNRQLKWKFKLIRRAVYLLEQFAEQGCIVWKHATPWGRRGLTEPYFISVFNEYINDLKRKGRGTGTIYSRRTVSEKFLRYLEQTGFHDCFKVTLTDVSNFVLYVSKQYQGTSMGTVLSALRSFLAFIAEAKFTSTDLACAVPSSRSRKTAIIPTITPEEEQGLLVVIDRETAKGKRDYAIILLALRTGMRPVDIAKLQLENLKWRTNTIELIQQKTGRMLILPLLADVGNAIIDYLLHSRLSSRAPYVFIHSHAPYTKFSSISFYNIVSGYMKKAGIRQNDGDERGLRCFRHSTAARLLAAETPLPIISTILGHADKNSTKIYLSTDLEHLRACALGLKGIEVAEGELA